MDKIPVLNHDVDGHSAEEPTCTTCLLPMQYQTKKDEKFFWQCFKCGKQYVVGTGTSDGIIEEGWSPPR